MTDKVQKIRKEVQRLQNELIQEKEKGFGSDVDDACILELQNVLTYIDFLQEEPVYTDFTKALAECIHQAQGSVVDPMVLAETWKDELIKLAKSEEPVSEDEIEKQFKAGDVVVYVSRQPVYSGLYLLGNPNDLSIGYSNANEPYQIALRNCTVASEDERKQFMRELYSNGYKWNEDTLRIEKEEPVSEDLGEYINELSKQFPEVSFAKLSRIAVRVSRWQRNQDVKNKLPKVINRTDLDEYAYQCAYDMSNDWAIENPTWHNVEDACKLGAEWQLNKIIKKHEENRD